MPAGLSLSLILPMIAAMSLPTVAVIVVKGPGVDDIYAVLGAVVASILAVMESLQKRRDYFHAVSMFLGSGFVGAFAPGPVYHLLAHLKWIPADAAMFGLWQTWAIAGFISGLNGWYLIHKTSDRLRDFIDRFKK
jgi:predicted membrane protein